MAWPMAVEAQFHEPPLYVEKLFVPEEVSPPHKPV
jgi:hypothetical protein